MIAAVVLAHVAPVAARLATPPGFTIETIARIDGARELAVSPSGDLFVGTRGRDVAIVADAEATVPAAPTTFAHLDDDRAAGVAFAADSLFVGTEHGVWRVSYRAGSRKAIGPPREIATLRERGSRGHDTTSVAVRDDVLYVAVGSSCNACTDPDPTRATIRSMTFSGSDVRDVATHVRNAVALATDPETGALWAGVAGQDELERGHPYEIFDAVSAHAGVPDYGWPTCYENRRPVRAGIDCTRTTVARVVFPAYETPIGAVFYPRRPTGTYAFPAAYRGGAFVTLHGSWHVPPVAPHVAFVAMRGTEPATAVDWNDPTTQWTSFVDGYQAPKRSRIGRPTGIAVGPQGSLFVADDAAGVVYRIRPTR